MCFNQLNDIGNDQINCFWHFKIEKNTQTIWKCTDTSMHLIFAQVPCAIIKYVIVVDEIVAGA